MTSVTAGCPCGEPRLRVVAGRHGTGGVEPAYPAPDCGEVERRVREGAGAAGAEHVPEEVDLRLCRAAQLLAAPAGLLGLDRDEETDLLAHHLRVDRDRDHADAVGDAVD